jgi:hypothetical protein
MNYREWDLSDISFGDAQLAVIYKNNEIERFDIPIAKFGEKYFDSINTDVDYFGFNGQEFEISISASNVGVHISIELLSDDDTDNLNEFDINIMFDSEEEIHADNLRINYYVPTAPYTATISSALYGLADNKIIIPMLDIENESKLASYKEDELIDFKHYLDISSLQYFTNQQDYEDAKLVRKQEKKDHGEMRTEYPELIQKTISMSKKISILNSLENKKNIIPVYIWDKTSTFTELEEFFNGIMNNFYNFAIRVYGNQNSFIEDIKKIKMLFDFHIIMDMDINFNTSDINYYIDIYKKDFSKIIYLGAQFKASGISIRQDDTNYNHIQPNQTLNTYENLLEDHSNIDYGDYCGFDRKTLSEMPKGGRPSARVVLCSLDISKQILIRRGWNEKDRKVIKGRESIGAINSMETLLCDIQKGLLDKVNKSIFLNEEKCDADAALKSFCPEREKPAVIKTLCIRHNIGSIKHIYT